MLCALIEKSVLHLVVLHSGEYFIHEVRLITSIQQWHWFAYKVARKCSSLGMTSLTKCLSQKLLLDCVWMNNIFILGYKMNGSGVRLKIQVHFLTRVWKVFIKAIWHKFANTRWKTAYFSRDTSIMFMYSPYVLQFVPYKQQHNIIIV